MSSFQIINKIHFLRFLHDCFLYRLFPPPHTHVRAHARARMHALEMSTFQNKNTFKK